MNRTFVAILIGLSLLFIENTLWSAIGWTRVLPDLSIWFVVLLALQGSSLSNVFSAFAFGTLQDISLGSYIGPHAAGYMLAYVVVRQMVESGVVTGSLGLFSATGVAWMVSLFGQYITLVFASGHSVGSGIDLSLLMWGFSTSLFGALTIGRLRGLLRVHKKSAWR